MNGEQGPLRPESAPSEQPKETTENEAAQPAQREVQPDPAAQRGYGEAVVEGATAGLVRGAVDFFRELLERWMDS
ncbi:hypothetical protein ACIRU8_45520 [Streptomyces sp. NPDC101175]|uniref:hypothetical protein n=1 Tax=Streptomyces sp. NPDC101175 TaxID=3366123 RepID=UPI00383330C1